MYSQLALLSFLYYLQVLLIHSLSEQTVARMQQPSVNALRYFINYTEALFFQSLSLVRLFVTPLTAARQASLSFTISWGLLKLMSIELMMPSSYGSSSEPHILTSWCIELAKMFLWVFPNILQKNPNKLFNQPNKKQQGSSLRKHDKWWVS